MKKHAASTCRVLITRPEHQAGPLAAALAAAGGQPILFPVIDIKARSTADLGAQLAKLPAADITVFVSPNAVQHGLVAAAEDSQLAVIGEATATALRSADRRVDIVPRTGFDTEALLLEPGLQNVAGKRVRIVRSDDGRALLGETLLERGARVDYVSVYHRQCHAATADELAAVDAAWRSGGIDYVIVMSVATLQFLLELLPAWCREALVTSVLVTPSARVLKTTQESLPGMRTLHSVSPATGDLLAAILADQEANTDNLHD